MSAEDLFDEFWEKFNTFELSHFKILARDTTRPLRQFLRDHGVWVRNERTYSIVKSLYDCTRSEKNVWIDDGHINQDNPTKPNDNATKNSSNSQDPKSDPMPLNPAKYN